MSGHRAETVLHDLAEDLVARGAWEGFDFAMEGRSPERVSQHGVELMWDSERDNWRLCVRNPLRERLRNAGDPGELVDDFVAFVAEIMRLRGRRLAPAGAEPAPLLDQDEADAVMNDLAEELERAGMPEGLVFWVHGLGGVPTARKTGRDEVMHVGFEEGRFRVWFDEKGSERTIVVSPRPEVACQVMRRECTRMVGDMPWAHPERLGPLADVTGWPEQAS